MIVTSEAKASSCRLEGLGYNEQLHLTVSNFPVVDVVKADGVPTDFHISDACKVTFANCKITGVLGEILTYNKFYITGMHSGYPETLCTSRTAKSTSRFTSIAP